MSAQIELTKVVLEFRAALVALAPTFAAAGLAPGHPGDLSDDFDHVAEALFEVLVRRPIARGKFGQPVTLPRYGFPPTGAEVPLLVDHDGSTTGVRFVEFDTEPQVAPGAFNAVIANGVAKGGLIFPLAAATRFWVVPSPVLSAPASNER